jgi:hypothetical protein
MTDLVFLAIIVLSFAVLAAGIAVATRVARA